MHKRQDEHSAGAVALRIAALSELAEYCTREILVQVGTRCRSIILIRTATQVHAWLNSCPHIGTSLNLHRDEFLDPQSGMLICATHGALFEPDTGRCVAGPCAGDRLVPVPVAIVDGEIYLETTISLPDSARR